MWEWLGFAGIAVGVGAVAWVLNRLLKGAQGGERGYAGNEDMTSSEAKSYQSFSGGSPPGE